MSWKTRGGLWGSVLHYVVRSRESVILDDAATHPRFAANPYICRCQCQCRARSILSLLLLNQAKLIGGLYLENNPAPPVFMPTRISHAETTRLLSPDCPGEHASVPRSGGTRTEDPAPGRRQHHRHLHLEFQRPDEMVAEFETRVMGAAQGDQVVIGGLPEDDEPP
jgi:GAF domain